MDGNLWVGWGMGAEGLDGVAVFNPEGKLIGRIDLPERVRQPVLRRPASQPPVHGGSTSLYSLYVNTQGAIGG